jgi:hydrogenase expression/formation protein HypE
VIVSGPVGAHGIAVLAAREGLPVGQSLRSDLAFLYPQVSRLFHLADGLRFMRDATRGGVAGVLNELVHGAAWGLRIEEAELPVSEEVATVADLLGLSPIEVANEGVFVAVVARRMEQEALDGLRGHPLARGARCIGHASLERPGSVVMTTRIGGTRIVDFPRGLLLPRIC